MNLFQNNLPVVQKCNDLCYALYDKRFSGVGDIVLDPMCGAGTSCVSAFKLGRRFIGVDTSPYAIECTYHRVMEVIESGDYRIQLKPNGKQSLVQVKDTTKTAELYKKHSQFEVLVKYPRIDWKSGDSFLILGDCLNVLQSIPIEIIDLIYLDPPFNTGKEWKSLKGFYDWIEASRKKRPYPDFGQH